MLGAPLQCSLLLVKGEKILQDANCAGAQYLFQQDKYYDVNWDTGDKSMQCGRKVIAVIPISPRYAISRYRDELIERSLSTFFFFSRSTR